MLAHGGMEEAQLLNDGGDGVGVGVLLVNAVGSLPEARRLHAGDPLQTLVLQHPRYCRKRVESATLKRADEDASAGR